MGGQRRAVVACEDHDGRVFYEFGWVRDIEQAMDAHRLYEVEEWKSGMKPVFDRTYTTTVEWAAPPRYAARYPTDADFAAALQSAERTIEASPAS